MIINFDVTGPRRKQLVTAIAGFTNCKAEYQYTPTYAYKIGPYIVTKDGELVYQDEDVQPLLATLAKQGFNPKDDKVSLKLSYNRESFDESDLNHLKQLIWAKGNLIKEALAIDSLPLEVTDEKVSLDWFKDIKPEEAQAYQLFANHLVDYAKKRTRVITQPREYKNPRYAFRCFLLQLGFIGPEYKEARKILLSKLHGSCAFRKEVTNHA